MIKRHPVPFLYISRKERKFEKVSEKGNIRGMCEGVGMTGFPGLGKGNVSPGVYIEFVI